jgi:hypothetical protein
MDPSQEIALMRAARNQVRSRRTHPMRLESHDLPLLNCDHREFANRINLGLGLPERSAEP